MGVLSTSSAFSSGTYARLLPAPTTLFPHARVLRSGARPPVGYLFYTRYDRGPCPFTPSFRALRCFPCVPSGPAMQNGRTWNQLERLLSEGLSQSRSFPSVCFGFSGPRAFGPAHPRASTTTTQAYTRSPSIAPLHTRMCLSSTGVNFK